MKWFLRWAEMYGYYSGHAHKSFKPRLKGVNGDGHEIIYLDQKELHTLQNYAPTANKQYLARVRDVFLVLLLHRVAIFGRCQAETHRHQGWIL